MKKVFLGGTCNGSTWRDTLIQMLKIDYFNPVVDNWDEEAYETELIERAVCDYCLYVITPRMTGVYSIAEVVDDSNKRSEKTIFCILEKDTNPFKNLSSDWNVPDYISFNSGQLKSLDKVGIMIEKNGGKYFKSLEQIADFLNNDNKVN